MPIVITRNTLSNGLRDYNDDVVDAIRIMLDYWAARAVTQMRTEARWTDRTTNARNGLAAQRFNETDGGSLVLYHSVPYGIWLEVRWSGRYAIVGPTLNNIGPQVMRSIQEGLARL
jgi:hypothetical protein